MCEYDANMIYPQAQRNLLLISKTYQRKRESWQVGCIAKKREGKERKMRESCLTAESDLEFKIGPFYMNSAYINWPVRDTFFHN